MKKIMITTLTALLLVTACNAKSGNNNQTAEAGGTESKVKTIHLTKAEFLKKVANYETNPNEWEYLG
jgi:hypothetical protein